MTQTPLSRSPGRFTHRGLNASGSCSGECGNVLGVENYCYVAVCSAALGASAPSEGGEGRGHTVAAARIQLVCLHYNWLNLLLYKKHSVPVPASELIKFNGNF